MSQVNELASAVEEVLVDEDALIAAYRSAVGNITDTVAQHAAPPVHSKPRNR